MAGELGATAARVDAALRELGAAGLLESGLRPGQVVGLQLPNLPQFLVAYFGALKAGMIVLPLNPLLKAPEIEYHLSDSSAAILIGFDSIHAEAAKACGSGLTRTCLEQQVAKQTNWTGGGLQGTINPAANKASQCFIVMKIEGGKFVQAIPSKLGQFYCSPQNVPIVKP